MLCPAGGGFGSDQKNIGVLRADVAPVGKRRREEALHGAWRVDAAASPVPGLASARIVADDLQLDAVGVQDDLALMLEVDGHPRLDRGLHLD